MVIMGRTLLGVTVRGKVQGPYHWGGQPTRNTGTCT